MLTTPESLEQTYRVRLAVEPAALLEPTYRLDPELAEHCRAAELRLLAGALETDSADALHERGVRFHEAIVGASGNPCFLDTVRRINRVRRLLSYRSMIDRKRYRQQCKEHLQTRSARGREQRKGFASPSATSRAHGREPRSDQRGARALISRSTRRFIAQGRAANSNERHKRGPDNGR